MPFYTDCFDCKQKCCRFFGVPADQKDNISTQGVSLEFYRSKELDRHPERYFELREGVTVKNGKFVIDSGVVTREMTCRLGKYLIVYSRCQELENNGKCRIYPTRPDMCKNFVAQTARKYLVPIGCIFDHDGLGEDFGI